MSVINQKEKEWMDYLLDEVKSPEAEERIRSEIDSDASAEHDFENLQSVIEQLKTLYPKQGSPMHDLTLDQKKELYASFTEIFPEIQQPVKLVPILRIFFYSLSAAAAVMLLVPLVQWIANPAQPPKIIDGDANDWVVPPPEIYTAPPPPKPKDIEKKEVEQIKIRPTIDDLDLRPLDVSDGGDFPNSGAIDWDNIQLDSIDDIIDIIDVDEIPKPIKQVAPQYPLELKSSKVNGRVYLEFVVNERGFVEQVRVLKSDQQAFEKPARDAILRWRFQPGKKDGAEVKVRMRIPFDFRIRD